MLGQVFPFTKLISLFKRRGGGRGSVGFRPTAAAAAAKNTQPRAVAATTLLTLAALNLYCSCCRCWTGYR